MCFDGDPVDTSPRDRGISVVAIASDAPRDATSHEKVMNPREHSPTRKKKRGNLSLKGGAA